MLIAVIGHGKSVEGTGWGKRIDSCDYVIRMWDCQWQNEADYGTKYDYGFVEAILLGTFYKFKKREPECGWVVVTRHKHQFQLPPRSEAIDQTEWNELGKRLGGLGATGKLEFTRGTIVACWAITHARPGDTVILVGFDNVYCGKALPVEDGFSRAYLDAPSTFTFRGYQENVRAYGNHDFGIELPVMRYLAAERGVHVTFSQDLWEKADA